MRSISVVGSRVALTSAMSQSERNAAGKTLKQEIRKHLAKEWTRRNEGKGKAKL